MCKLLSINTSDEGRITISARDLYQFLEATERFNSWFERMKQYGFIDGEDFTSVKSFTLVNNGAQRELDDYQLTIETAKEIAMLQRNEKGKQARQYFIRIEKEWNSPEKVMARALSIANKEIAKLTLSINELKPKAIFADAVTTSKTSILIGELAKILKQNGIEIGQNRFFEWLRENGYLMKYGSSKNMPTQKSMEQGLFEIKERTINNPDGSIRVTKTSKITGKGQMYFVNLFKKINNLGN